MNIAGLTWLDGSGQSLLSGPLLDLFHSVKRRLDAVADGFGAQELRVPPTLAATDLDRLDWFRSFPHLATLATWPEPDEDNLAAFAEGKPHELARCTAVLTPAACYHVYGHVHGCVFDGPQRFTLQTTCFRREATYRPLERQWAFTMREVVAIGEVGTFLSQARAAAERLAADLDLPVRWERATDPFFRPPSNPQYVMQVVDPTKHELVFGDGLAIGSLNLHHDHFGRAFDIRTADGPAHTACLAFGLERWLAAIVHRHGPDPAGWPQ